jgi:Fic family protein
MKPPLESNIIEFLQHSNYIEREYSNEALEDACKAWEYAIENKENFSADYILNIHRILLERLRPELAGKFRNYAVRIGSVHKPKLSEKQLTENINDWIKGYKSKKRINHKKIKEMHVAFEEIHPFGDGNGRTGRILMNVQCIKSNLPLIIIHQGKEQQDYYKWFPKESEEDFADRLIKFMDQLNYLK